MEELISHPGIKFYIFKLEGVLTYSLTLNTKPPREYELADSDFEGVNAQIKDEDDKYKSGVAASGKSASAVGVDILIIKNDGILKINFEGRGAGTACWIFDGLQEVGGGRMYAAAQTQTVVPAMNESGMQTSPALIVHKGIQTISGVQAETGMQTDSGAMKDSETQTDNRSADHDNSKRNASPSIAQRFIDGHVPVGRKRRSSEPLPPNKRARTKQDTDPWPRFLFMKGERNFPAWKGEAGFLCIDVQSARVWYEGFWGCKNAGGEEKRYVDLRNDILEVVYAPHSQTNTRCRLLLRHETSSGGTRRYTLFSLDHQPGSGPIFGNNDGMSDNQEFVYPDATIIVDAIVHCIDITSGRDPVHDPNAAAEYQAAVRKHSRLVKKRKKYSYEYFQKRIFDKSTEWNEINAKERRRLARYKEYRKITLPAVTMSSAVNSQTKEKMETITSVVTTPGQNKEVIDPQTLAGPVLETPTLAVPNTDLSNAGTPRTSSPAVSIDDLLNY